MALVAPLLLALGIGSVELGNFMLDQHRLTKSVRDAARYAARAPFSAFSACTSTASNVASLATGVTNLVRTGQLSGGTDQLPNWGNAASSVTVQMRCSTAQVGGQTMSGIYAGYSSGAAVVIVSGTLRYQPLVGAFGFRGTGFDLYAQEEAPVAGV